MRSKISIALILALAFTLSLAATAQDKIKYYDLNLPEVVYLPCQITHGGDVASDVKVTNTSGSTIPSGKKITVAIPYPNSTSVGTRVNLLEASFLNGSSKNLLGPAAHTNTCKAWFPKN
jgi:hypothetical protein